MTLRRHAVAVLAVLLAAGCALLPPRLAAPQVELVGVRVVDARLPQVRLAVELSLTNPNAVAIDLAALEADLAIEGEPVVTARLLAPATLPPRQATRVALGAIADAGAALAGVGRALGGGRALAYDASGRAILADGTIYPFRRRGVLPAAAATQ